MFYSFSTPHWESVIHTIRKQVSIWLGLQTKTNVSNKSTFDCISFTQPLLRVVLLDNVHNKQPLPEEPLLIAGGILSSLLSLRS